MPAAGLRTLRVRADSRGQHTSPWDPNLRERFIYTLWHENLGVAFALKTVAPLRILVSQSRDGELVSQLAKRFGVQTVRGSSSHGGVEALEEMISLRHTHHFLVAPDGPRGPRRHVKRGLAYLAAHTGMRVVPFGVGFSARVARNSWDRTAIPKPGSTMTIVAGPIIQVPPEIGKRGLEHYRLLIENSLEAANAAADAWAAGEPREVLWPDVAARAA